MHRFILSGVWAISKDQAHRVFKILNQGEVNASDCLDMQISEVNAEIIRASKIISYFFGSNAIKIVLSGSNKEFNIIRRRFEMAVNPINPDKYLMSDLLFFVDNQFKCMYTINELGLEIALIKKFSKDMLLNEVKNVDVKKLSFALGVLSSKTPLLTPLRVEILKKISENI